MAKMLHHCGLNPFVFVDGLKSRRLLKVPILRIPAAAVPRVVEADRPTRNTQKGAMLLEGFEFKLGRDRAFSI